MPAARLTGSSSPVADAVLAVLAGGDLTQIAAASGMDPGDLTDAAQAYHTAGTIALERRETSRWHQVRVRPGGQQPPDRALATVVGPLLDNLTACGGAARWWYMNKPPGWRIRLRDIQPDAASDLFDGLTASGTITAWETAIYEPETAAFGGPTGMEIAHDLFCDDTSSYLAYLRQNKPQLEHHQISVLLVNAMLAAAGLDQYERGDIFVRVAAMRPRPAPGTIAQLAQLVGQLRALLALPAGVTSELFSGSGNSAAAARWHEGFTDAGRRFAVASSGASLSRGLRAVLAHTVIFHWNRLGLTATTQTALALAASQALLPGD
jgi:thiopeptide-type bacteriocin biosynthesis protein